ncbi:MAG: translation initiation factor IF-2 [Parcubacteria group bacterium Gr01-1014_38]|nr:MAG: translation initiation factor IF-2 [Parcubacteria group bacterium Gr01-1014_38]
MSVKLQDLVTELRLTEPELVQTLSATGIKVPPGVKRIPDKDAGRLRVFVSDQRRRRAKKQELIKLPSVITVRELAEKLALPVGEVIRALLKNGLPVTLNEQIDYETAAIIASDLGYQTEENVAATEESTLTPEKLWEILKKEEESRRQPRPPVVIIMGHVDHGKTTLLDAIRKTRVAATEAGGITQRVSSYQARTKGKLITFIDTPGHEVFEFMRKRSASIGDIAILVVAADEGVKEQTEEAFRHAQESEIPLIVAFTKVDKPEANLERAKRQVADLGLTLEEWGGTTPTVAVSAKTGAGLDTLLETILAVNTVHPTAAIPDRPALASIVEAHRDPKIGPLATALLHTGTLKVGDHLVVGQTTGTARKLLDFTGAAITEAGPSTPVTIIGLDGAPVAGEILQVMAGRSAAREKARLTVRSLPQTLAPKSVKRTREERERGRARVEPKARDEEEKGPKLLPLVLKAESQGSLEAIRNTVAAMAMDAAAVHVVRADVGNVTDSDVRTAEAAGGLILGFSVPVMPTAQKLADTAGVPVRNFDVIYSLTEEVRKRLEDLVPPEVIRTDLGTLTILKVFFSIRGRQIVGGRVQSGQVRKGANVEALRGDERVAVGTVTELQENKVPVDDVRAGRECGLTFQGEGKKIKNGDLLHFYTEEVRKKSLRQQAVGSGQ